MEPALHTTELTYQEKTKLNQYVTEIIEKHKKNAADIDILVNDSVTRLAIADARTEELGSQGAFKGLWNELTGVNRKIRADLDGNLASSQYAAIQMLQKLAEQNLISIELITKVNKKLNTSVNELDGEINEIYSILRRFFSQIQNYNTEQAEKINRLEDEIKKLKGRLPMNCKKCETKITEGQLICFKCGEVQELPTFSDANLNNEFLAKVKSIADVIKNDEISTEYMWDETVKKYARVIEQTKAVLSTEIMADKVTIKMFKDSVTDTVLSNFAE